MAIIQNYIFNNLVDSSNTINNKLFNQTINIAYAINKNNLIDMFNLMDKQYKYTGYSTELNNITDYYILLNIINLYKYMFSIYDDVTSWETFIAKTNLSKTISKLNCNNINFNQLTNINLIPINTSTDIINPFYPTDGNEGIYANDNKL